MSKARFILIALFLCGAAALAVALLVLSRRTAALEERARDAVALQEENRELRSRADQLANEVRTLREQLGSAENEPLTTPPRKRLQAQLPPGTLEALRSLGQLREDLAATRSRAEQLQSRVSALEADLESAHREYTRVSAQLGESREQLSGANRLAEAMQEELKGKNERLAPLQSANQNLREENRQAREKIRKLGQLSAELEDVNRRREAYLTGILRRYRELTEQYRALATRLEDKAEAPSSSDVTRIENTVSMAEEDLRQLRNLNSQAERIQRQIARD